MATRGILAALALALVPAGNANATTVRHGPLRLRVGILRQHDLLAAKGFGVIVSNTGRRSSRLRVTVAAGRAVGPIRRVRLAAHTGRAVAAALPASTLTALQGCSVHRLTVRAVPAGSGRALTLDAPVLLEPPLCGRFFGPHAVWNEALDADAPVDPASGTMIAALDREIAHEYAAGPPPNINTTSYSVPVYTVPADQPRIPVELDQPDLAPTLTRQLSAVPLPPGALPAAGTDAQLVVWQPARDTMWEFWQLRSGPRGWHAAWGGVLTHVSTGPGHYVTPHETWGATGSALPLLGGLITPQELERGRIDHALALALPTARAGVYAEPAQRTDGQTSDDATLPEGARLRIDPALDIAALHLPPALDAIAVAAQRYGIILRDRGSDAALYAQDPVSLGEDPYPGLFGGLRPSDLLRQFPWNHLQVMRLDLRTQPGQGQWPIGCFLGCP